MEINSHIITVSASNVALKRKLIPNILLFFQNPLIK